MDPRAVATAYAAGRMALGAALTVQPRRAGAAWLGRDARRPSVAVVTSAMGVRDLAIGAGTLAALRRGEPARAWLCAGAASDLTDLVATLRAREHLPAASVAAVVGMAAGASAAGAWLAGRLL